VSKCKKMSWLSKVIAIAGFALIAWAFMINGEGQLVFGICFVIASVIVYFFERKTSKSSSSVPSGVMPQATMTYAQPAPPPPPCPTCNQPLTLVQQYNRWYCDNCQKYV
jgi:hypothetical protein